MKKNRKKIIYGLIGFAIVFVLIQFVFSNKHILWFLNSKFYINSVQIEQRFEDEGIVSVHEKIHYDMRKPFRGLHREIPSSRYVKMEDVKIWVEGYEDAYVEFLRKTPETFEARVWLVPYGSERELDPAGFDDLVLNVSYKAKYVVEKGVDISQILRNYWGRKWESPIGEINADFVFDSNYFPSKVVTHPIADVSQIGNTINLNLKNISPYTFCDVRFLFENLPDLKYAAKNNGLTLVNVKYEEDQYYEEKNLKFLLLFGSYGIFIIVVFLTFFLFGREPKVDYDGIYERDLPSKDSPDLINAIVKNISGSVDQNGIQSVIMNLYRLNYIDLEKNDKKQTIIKIKNYNLRNDLSMSEIEFFKFIKKFYDQKEGFNFSYIKSDLMKSESLAKDFNKAYRKYISSVTGEVKKRGYFHVIGYYLAVFFSILMLIGAIIIPEYITGGNTPDLQTIGLLFSPIMWFTAAIVILLPKDVFGKWSKEGREFYMKWENFGKFLSEFSLLSDYPPQSIVVWEEYLVYATALGIADKVESALKKLVPREVWENQSTHSYMYTAAMFGIGREFTSLRNTAVTTVNKSSSGGSTGGGGFGGGAGSVGGGSGGGGGGAF